jgi:dihydrodipicolinate synthase/N-acetylneuraminate lyase
MSEDPAKNLLLLKQSQKLRSLSNLLRKNPARGLKLALHRLGRIPWTKVIDPTQEGSSESAEELTHFLQVNFPLQTSP